MKQDVGFYLHREEPNLGKKLRISHPAQPLSSYHIDALASRLSPHTRTSAVTNTNINIGGPNQYKSCIPLFCEFDALSLEIMVRV